MRKHISGLVVCLITVCGCILANLFAPLIDCDMLRRNAAEAVDSVWNAGASRQIVGGFDSARLDDYTTVLMVKTACFTGNIPYINKVFGGLRVEQAVREDTDDWGAYCTYVPGNMIQEDDIVQSYTRYWHGYMFPLRLGMSFMSFNNVMMLCYLAETVLFAAILVMAVQKRVARKAIPAFTLTYFLMMPAAMGTCINYFSCIFISLCASIFVLCVGGVLERKTGMGCMFVSIGILTSFMDLLTFPIVTLVFPLTFWLCIKMEDGIDLPHIIRIAIILTACWGAGYAGMWALKWGINGILYGIEAVNGIFRQIMLRISANADGADISRLDGIRANFEMILNKPVFKLTLVTYGMLQILSIMRVLRHGDFYCLKSVFGLLIPVGVPVFWILATTNHAVIHGYYVFRSLWSGLFPLSTIFACLFWPAMEDSTASVV